MMETALAAAIAFISTNIDDLFVIMLLFTQAGSSLRSSDIYKGQLVGIAALTTVSMIAAAGMSVFPLEYIGLLGLVPIILGIRLAAVELSGKRRAEGEYEKSESKGFGIAEGISRRLSFFARPQMLGVMSMTIAGGGDNIGIYVPMFAGMNAAELAASAVVFGVLTFIWCRIGSMLSTHPLLRRIIRRYEKILVPAVFVCIGVYIVVENGTLNLFLK
ncbi:cadmium resistance transporter (plasmid) [Peptoclostridium acidaminophilum DSM 3953]|uniref:Cadmium resistance transporter n=1 Tax=Peptoclostridium acidaminophilum DSM 3953 TaxID=1286171 RepID=W8TBL4_PEPAC|nr:cadmium resistance transporter [Peptoclostridium acidaminophilum]AHM58220.1 cadmium resistance transporter [Peptoclostridium acidaminophilum DSM 3953]